MSVPRGATTVGVMADHLINEHDEVARYLESQRYGANGMLTAPSRELMALERAYEAAKRTKPHRLAQEIARLEDEVEDLGDCDCARCLQ